MNHNSTNPYESEDSTKSLDIMIMTLLGLAVISHIVMSLDWDGIFQAISYII
jgi:hypothetical protein